MVSDEWVLGLVEGEGCFSVSIQRIVDRKPRKTKTKANWKNPSIGFRVHSSFRVTLVEEDKAGLLAIKEHLGVGEIYKRKIESVNCRQTLQYYVQSMVDLEKVAEFFKKLNFCTTKGESFRLWLNCLEIIKSGRHNTKDGLLEICYLRDKMNHRLSKNSRKTDDIKKLLEIKPEHIEFHAKQSKLLHNNSLLVSKDWYNKRQGNYKRPDLMQNPSETP